MPANIIAKMMRKLTAPRGCCWQNSTSGLRRRGTGGAVASAGAAIVIVSPVADARVEHCVEQVDYEVGEYVEHGNQRHHALDQGKVIARNTLHEQLADAVEIEHLLGDDESADEKSEFEPDDGDCRKQRIAQRVTGNDHAFEHAL